MNLRHSENRPRLAGMKAYGQYCPIARASELLAERWTPIIIRNLLNGCSTFGEIRQGAPGIPKALLADRLVTLERCGIITAEPNPRTRGHRYQLTEKGWGLKSVCDAMGSWGAKWLDLEPDDLDPAYALWATCKLVDMAKVPRNGVVVRVDLADEPDQRYWMLLQPPRAELCSSYPGRAEDLVVSTDTETLARWNLRQISLDEARRAGRFEMVGLPSLARAFVSWIRPSPFAEEISR